MSINSRLIKQLPIIMPSWEANLTSNNFFEEQFFPIAFFHLGLLTRQDAFYFAFPNLNVYQLFVDYFNEYHKNDTTNPFANTMLSFSRHPNLEALFRCYWEEYVQRLPEPIFMQVNENFYRTTFYLTLYSAPLDMVHVACGTTLCQRQK
ncbi:MAG: hypothetical protein AAF639_34425 [Chloroflexota bacterium]